MTRSATDREPEAQIEVPKEMSINECAVLYHEQTMMIASVGQVELGNIMHFSVTDHVLKCAQMGKTIKPLRERIVEQSGWMEREESQPLDSCQASAREDSPKHGGCDDQGRSCSVARTVGNRQRLNRGVKRDSLCTEQRVRNLER